MGSIETWHDYLYSLFFRTDNNKKIYEEIEEKKYELTKIKTINWKQKEHK